MMKIIGLMLVFLLVCSGVVVAEDSMEDCNWWCAVKKFIWGDEELRGTAWWDRSALVGEAIKESDLPREICVFQGIGESCRLGYQTPWSEGNYVYYQANSEDIPAIVKIKLEDGKYQYQGTATNIDDARAGRFATEPKSKDKTKGRYEYVLDGAFRSSYSYVPPERSVEGETSAGTGTTPAVPTEEFPKDTRATSGGEITIVEPTIPEILKPEEGWENKENGIYTASDGSVYVVATAKADTQGNAQHKSKSNALGILHDGLGGGNIDIWEAGAVEYYYPDEENKNNLKVYFVYHVSSGGELTDSELKKKLQGGGGSLTYQKVKDDLLAAGKVPSVESAPTPAAEEKLPMVPLEGIKTEEEEGPSIEELGKELEMSTESSEKAEITVGSAKIEEGPGEGPASSETLQKGVPAEATLTEIVMGGKRTNVYITKPEKGTTSKVYDQDGNEIGLVFDGKRVIPAEGYVWADETAGNDYAVKTSKEAAEKLAKASLPVGEEEPKPDYGAVPNTVSEGKEWIVNDEGEWVRVKDLAEGLAEEAPDVETPSVPVLEEGLTGRETPAYRLDMVRERGKAIEDLRNEIDGRTEELEAIDILINEGVQELKGNLQGKVSRGELQKELTRKQEELEKKYKRKQRIEEYEAAEKKLSEIDKIWSKKVKEGGELDTFVHDRLIKIEDLETKLKEQNKIRAEYVSDKRSDKTIGEIDDKIKETENKIKKLEEDISKKKAEFSEKVEETEVEIGKEKALTAEQLAKKEDWEKVQLRVDEEQNKINGFIESIAKAKNDLKTKKDAVDTANTNVLKLEADQTTADEALKEASDALKALPKDAPKKDVKKATDAKNAAENKAKKAKKATDEEKKKLTEAEAAVKTQETEVDRLEKEKAKAIEKKEEYETDAANERWSGGFFTDLMEDEEWGLTTITDPKTGKPVVTKKWYYTKGWEGLLVTGENPLGYNVGGALAAANKLGSYQGISTLLFPDTTQKWMDNTNNEFFRRMDVVGSLVKGKKWCKYDERRTHKVAGQNFVFIETMGGTYQFVGSLMAERSSKKVPILCNIEDDSCPDEDFVCQEGLCYADEDAETPIGGYLYKIDWGVTAPVDEKQTPYIDEDGKAVKFNVMLEISGRPKWLYKKSGVPRDEVIALSNGESDRGMWLDYMPGEATQACIMFGVASEDNFDGKPIDHICATIKVIERGVVDYETTTPSSKVSSGEVEVESGWE